MKAILALTCILALLVGGSARSMELVREGKACGRLLVGASAQGAAAVTDLQRVLEKMSGTRLPQEAGSGQGVVLAIGQAQDFPGLKLDRPLAKYEVAIQAAGGTCWLLGGSEQAVSDAVYTLLDRLGCRWYLPGEIGEVIPRLPTVEVGSLEVRETPAFAMRSPWYAWGVDGLHTSPAGGQRWADWLRRNRCGGEVIRHGHNLLTPIPRERYFATHPEYYALVAGKRKPTQPCTSNPDLVPIFVDTICRFLDENPGNNSYSLCPEDNDQFCECDRCRALDSPRRDPGFQNKVVMTDRLVKFFNQVAAGVRQRHPEAIVSFYGYLNHTLPPTTVKLGPGVAVVLTAQQFCSIHGMSDACRSRRHMKEILEGYGKQTPYLYVYEYDPAPGSAGLPYPLYLAHARDLRIYRELGVKGFSIESHKAWASTFPNHYFWARGMWNPEMDEQAALSELCRDLYGPGAAAMERYYRLLAEVFARSPVHPNWGLSKYHQVWSPQQTRALSRLLVEAERATREAGPAVRERILYARLEQNLLNAYLDFQRLRQEGQLARALQAGERVVRILSTQRDLNEDLCLYVECIRELERQVLTTKHEWPQSADFAAHNDLVCRLPVTWAFRPDPDDEGAAQGWAAPDLELPGWGRIRTDSQWHQQVEGDLNGVAWARTSFRVPEQYRGRQVRLYVGALDEAGTLYLNGEEILRRPPGLADNSWMEPFEIDISGRLRFDAPNVLAVRAEAEQGLGGLWRGALVYSPR